MPHGISMWYPVICLMKSSRWMVLISMSNLFSLLNPKILASRCQLAGSRESMESTIGPTASLLRLSDSRFDFSINIFSQRATGQVLADVHSAGYPGMEIWCHMWKDHTSRCRLPAQGWMKTPHPCDFPSKATTIVGVSVHPWATTCSFRPATQDLPWPKDGLHNTENNFMENWASIVNHDNPARIRKHLLGLQLHL